MTLHPSAWTGCSGTRFPNVLKTRLTWAVLPLLLFITCFALPVKGATIHVPGDQTTIRLGIQAAVRGDTVLVACGIYYEHDLEISSGVCLRSEAGTPECATIDAAQQGRVLYCSQVDASTRIEGFTLTGGSVPDGHGGGIYCTTASPTISRCILTGNYSRTGGSAIYCFQSDPVLSECRFLSNLESIDGGGLYCTSSSPTLSSCVFAWNSAMFWGGAIFCSDSSPHLTNCTLVANEARSQGGGIWCVYESHPVIENTIIAFSSKGAGVHVYSNPGHQSDVTLSCCDVFGNADGNYAGVIDDPTGTDGNISANPFFCDVVAGDFSVWSISPCLPEYNECGIQIGALGEGCTAPAAVSDGLSTDPLRGWRISNPMIPGSSIGFTLTRPSTVSLSIFDCSGRTVSELIEAQLLPGGTHEIRWDATNARGMPLNSGIYFCRLSVGGNAAEVRKIVLAR